MSGVLCAHAEGVAHPTLLVHVHSWVGLAGVAVGQSNLISRTRWEV